MDKKSMFDVFKKVVNEVAVGSEKLFQKVAEKLNDESAVHQEILRLFTRLNNVLKNYKGAHAELLKETVGNLIGELKIILEKDSESPTSKFPTEQLALAEKCMLIIDAYRPQLEKDPGFWERMKTAINLFIEKISQIEKTFAEEEVDFSADEEFIGYKKSILDLKNKLSGGTLA